MFKRGDHIYFNFHGERIFGIVEKVNPKTYTVLQPSTIAGNPPIEWRIAKQDASPDYCTKYKEPAYGG